MKNHTNSPMLGEPLRAGELTRPTLGEPPADEGFAPRHPHFPYLITDCRLRA